MNNNLKLAKTKLRYCTWNVRTLSQLGKLELVAKALDTHNVDFACLQETRSDSSETTSVCSPGSETEYIFYSSKGTTNGQQGVTIAIQSWYRDLVSEWNPISSRIALLTIETKPIPISIIAAYAPTNSYEAKERQDFYQQLESVLQTIPRRNFLVVGGDMNAQLTSNNTSQVGACAIGVKQCLNGDLLADFVSQNRLCVTNTLFQHRRSRLTSWVSPDGLTRNQIDYILVRERWRSSVINSRSHWSACNIAKSDHAPVIATIKLRLFVKKKANKRVNLAFDSLKNPRTSEHYNIELRNRFSKLSTLPDTVDELCVAINSNITSAAKKCLPKRRRRKKIWISDTTISLVRTKGKIPASHRERKKELDIAIASSIKEDHENYWSSIASSMEQANNVGDTKKLYQLIKESTGKRAAVSDLLKDQNGIAITKLSDKMDQWKAHFDELNRPPPPDGYKQCLSKAKPEYTISCEPPSLEEVVTAIQKLKYNKAAGNDDISPELLKYGSPALAPMLVLLFAKIWECEQTPTDWDLSVIVPLFKKGDKADCRNYRGISLQSLISKTFENILLSRFRDCRDKKTRESQAGFRPGRGCCDQIFTLRRILEWRHEFRKPTLVAFLDFTAAFDSLDRSAIWDIMKADGMPNKLLNLIKALYSDTKAVVRVYNNDTESFRVKTGVRQGAITSPVIFNYAIDWILSCAIIECQKNGYQVGVSTGNQLITDTSYADDISILASGATELDFFAKQIARFGGLIGLFISVKKSKVLSCCIQRPCVTINTEALENVDSFAYLGSDMKANGSAEKEVSRRIARASSVFNTFHHHIWTRHEISRRTKIRIYKASVVSILLYASESWSLRKEDEYRLDVFHHRCLRRILGVTWEDRISNSNVRKMSGMPITISKIIQHRRLKFFGHTLRMQDTRLPKMALFASAPCDWKRPQGGVLSSWRRLVHKETRQLTNHVRFFRGNRKQWESCGTEWLRFMAELAAERKQWQLTCEAMVQDVGPLGQLLH